MRSARPLLGVPVRERQNSCSDFSATFMGLGHVSSNTVLKLTTNCTGVATANSRVSLFSFTLHNSNFGLARYGSTERNGTAKQVVTDQIMFSIHFIYN
jgi:hypothetical protein